MDGAGHPTAGAPERTCVGCRRRRPQGDLIRLARTPRGVVVADDGRRAGRGAYVCDEPDCIEAVGRRGGSALARALRVRPDDLVAALDQLNGLAEQGIKERQA